MFKTQSIMKQKFEIKNCFQFVCPLEWDNLKATDDKNIRFCGSCEKQVYKATDLDSFQELSDQNKCVAYKKDKSTPIIMGEPIPAMAINFGDGTLTSFKDLVNKKSLD